MSALHADNALAATIATAAGTLLLDLRAALVDPDLDTLKAEGDRSSHEFIMQELRRARPDDAVLSEEAADDAARLTADRVWIVDPLDGTREYGEGRSDWAVHVALVVDGTVVASAVALPGLAVTLTADPAT